MSNDYSTYNPHTLRDKIAHLKDCIEHLTKLVETRNAQLDLLREDNAALNAAMQDDPLDHYPTCELMAALHSAVTHSNGLDFCERDTMLELAAMLRMEAVRRGSTPAL
jgi:hypothetical protein